MVRLNSQLTPKVETALLRIKYLYDQTKGKCILSFSGGKDSTVLAELYLMAKERGMVGHIPLVFADTQVEYDATYRFVEWFSKNKQEVEVIKTSKPFAQVLREYGKPTVSKLKTASLARHQSIIKEGGDPLENPSTGELISGVAWDGENKKPKLINGKEYVSRQALSYKHFNLLHPDHEYKMSAECCTQIKKKPFYDYYRENIIDGYMTGMRKAEGGARSVHYKTCKSFITLDGIQILHVMPMFYWKDEDVDNFIKEYNIKLSDAYGVYGLFRTGCIGCPFAKDKTQMLKALYDHEPNKYKAVIKWLGDVYLDLEVELPFDEEYMKRFEERKPIVEKRRLEMIKKYRPEALEYLLKSGMVEEPEEEEEPEEVELFIES